MTTYKGKEYKDASPYLAPAKMAVEYVKRVMDIGESNTLAPWEWKGKLARFVCVGELRERVEKGLATITDAAWKDQLEVSASWAKLYCSGTFGLCPYGLGDTRETVGRAYARMQDT